MATQNSNFSKTVPKDAPEWLSISTSIVLVVIGLGIGFYTYSQNQLTKLLHEKGVQVNGTVSFVDRTVDKNEKMNHYTISYIYNNIPNTYKTSLKYVYLNINEDVTLLVNPEKPSEAMLLNEDDMDKGSYLWAIFMVIAGGLIYKYRIKKPA